STSRAGRRRHSRRRSQRSWKNVATCLSSTRRSYRLGGARGSFANRPMCRGRRLVSPAYRGGERVAADDRGRPRCFRVQCPTMAPASERGRLAASRVAHLGTLPQKVSAMRVYVESVLPCPPEKVWEEVLRPALHRPQPLTRTADSLLGLGCCLERAGQLSGA